jgi:hypothetical protein
MLQLRRGVPRARAAEPALLRGGGLAAHAAMYLLVLVLVVSGACHWYLGWPHAHAVHEAGRVTLTGIVGLHVAGALTHHLILRDHVLMRMLVAERPGDGPAAGLRGRLARRLAARRGTTSRPLGEPRARPSAGQAAPDA